MLIESPPCKFMIMTIINSIRNIVSYTLLDKRHITRQNSLNFTKDTGFPWPNDDNQMPWTCHKSASTPQIQQTYGISGENCPKHRICQGSFVLANEPNTDC